MTIAKEKKSSIVKPVIIVIIGFLLVPLLTAAITYYSSENFRYKTNELLGALLPGSAGAYFEKQPTKQDREEINQLIAKHYINYDDDRLVDKLLLIKAEDSQLYNNLIILLNRENSNKMTKVRESLRRTELKSDVFQRILEEIDLENETQADSLIRYYTSLKVSDAVAEIERTFDIGELTLEQLPTVFEKLPTDTSAKYLTYLDSDLQQKIRFRLSSATKNELDKQIEGIKLRTNQLIEAAQVIENKQVDQMLDEIGNSNQYSLEDLAVIYRNLSLDKGGSVLAKVQDVEFINGLYDSISELEKLNDESGSFSKNLSATVQIYQKYNANIDELSKVYEKMTVQELASIADQMLRGNQVYQRHQLEDGQELVFSQERLLIDIFRLLKPTLVADVMEQMDTARAVELSSKMMAN